MVDAKICACAILDKTPVNTLKLDTDQLRIAFDGDAVLFDDSVQHIEAAKNYVFTTLVHYLFTSKLYNHTWIAITKRSG